MNLREYLESWDLNEAEEKENEIFPGVFVDNKISGWALYGPLIDEICDKSDSEKYKRFRTLVKSNKKYDCDIEFLNLRPDIKKYYLNAYKWHKDEDNNVEYIMPGMDELCKIIITKEYPKLEEALKKRFGNWLDHYLRFNH